jgi:transposase
MNHYAGIDVSLESSHVCVIDGSGKIVREAKVASEPEALIAWFGSMGLVPTRIGLETGPLSQWLYARMRDAGLCRAFGDAARSQRFQDHPGEDGPEGCQGIAELMRWGGFARSIASRWKHTRDARDADRAQACTEGAS